ncbi:MAG: hypothetical protein QM757_42410 [Paludibaculum sp.]
MIKYYPTPNLAWLDSIGRNNFYNTGSAQFNTDNFDIRVDHNLTDRQRLFGRLLLPPLLQRTAPALPRGHRNR